MTQIPEGSVGVTALQPVYYNGQTFATGQKFPMVEGSVQFYERDRLVVRSAITAEVVVPKVEKQEFGSEAEELVTLKALWDTESEITPTEYLSKFPEGPHGDLAMRIIELEAEQAESAQQ